MQRLDGRVAVVTGAAGGIGRALAELLVAEGMSVVVADIDAAALEATAEEIGAVAVPTDVTSASLVQSLADTVIDRFGAVHVLCNNAGVSGRFARTWATSLEDWQWVHEVNVMGVVHGLRAFVPLLLEQDEAHIVNTGSAACFEALPGMGVYAASKHAVLGLSEALRRDLEAARANVGVSVLIPGGVVRTSIMSSERSWPTDRLGPLVDRAEDPVSDMVRAGFTDAIANGLDPAICAGAAVEQGIKGGAYLVSDDPEVLAKYRP